MIATDNTQPQKLDISFVLLLATQDGGAVPLMMSSNNGSCRKLDLMTIPQNKKKQRRHDATAMKENTKIHKETALAGCYQNGDQTDSSKKA